MSMTRKQAPRGGHNEKVVGLLNELLQSTTDPTSREKLEKALQLTQGLDDYLDETVSPVGEVQAKIWAETLTEPWEENFKKGLMSYSARLSMLSSSYQSSFLKIFAEVTRAEKILEIGMFTGGSASSFCASPYCTQVVALDKEPYLEKFVKSRLAGTPAEAKLRIMIGKGMDSLAMLKDEGAQFDLVFLDAEKDGYINYYNFLMDNSLLRPDGCILVDNVLWQGEVYPNPTTEWGQLTHDFNAHVAADSRVVQVILPMRDGMMIIKPVKHP